jgi:hypothetical protein
MTAVVSPPTIQRVNPWDEWYDVMVDGEAVGQVWQVQATGKWWGFHNSRKKHLVMGCKTSDEAAKKVAE